MFRQNYATVSLKALRQNYKILQQSLDKNIKIIPVVKADAYGHGLIPIVETLINEGAKFFAVALIEEGITLRKNGIDNEIDILVMGINPLDKIVLKEAINNNLTLTICSNEMLKTIEEVAKDCNKKAYVHIKLDTGMNRIGINTLEEVKSVASTLLSIKNVIATGVYTHIADGDGETRDSKEFTKKQWQLFEKWSAYFPESLSRHVANSACVIGGMHTPLSYARIGISLYGYPPLATNLQLTPILTWKAQIVWIHFVNAGESVGYARSYIAKEQRKIATVCVGYGDGYSRLLSNKGYMLLHGQKVPIVGRVCMDQTLIDITDIKQAEIGDMVTLIGSDKNESITAETIANLTDTISYEVLLNISKRVPKRYLD